MTAWIRAALLATMAGLAPVAAPAVQPDEVLANPALEARARDISRDLRCLVCRNESIDESNAALARDMRLLVRERLVAGDSDAEVVDFVTDRYGEYVLLNPRADGSNLILWLSGPAMLLVAGGIAVVYLRGRATGAGATGDADLSDDERARLDAILKE